MLLYVVCRTPDGFSIERLTPRMASRRSMRYKKEWNYGTLECLVIAYLDTLTSHGSAFLDIDFIQLCPVSSSCVMEILVISKLI